MGENYSSARADALSHNVKSKLSDQKSVTDSSAFQELGHLELDESPVLWFSCFEIPVLTLPTLPFLPWDSCQIQRWRWVPAITQDSLSLGLAFICTLVKELSRCRTPLSALVLLRACCYFIASHNSSVGMDLKAHLVQSPYHGQRHFPLD